MELMTQKLNWWLFSWRVLDDIRLTRNADIYNNKCFNDFQQVSIFSLRHMILFWSIRHRMSILEYIWSVPPSIIWSQHLDFCIKSIFYNLVKIFKDKWRFINKYIYSWIWMRIWMHWIDITVLYIYYWICMFVDVHWSKFSWWIHRKFQLWYSVQMRPRTRLSCVRVCQLK